MVTEGPAFRRSPGSYRPRRIYPVMRPWPNTAYLRGPGALQFSWPCLAYRDRVFDVMLGVRGGLWLKPRFKGCHD